jgi:extracellular factor (EF) 3-hydroxypalmitic acid methyl ester biosynthesis protein
MVHFTNEMGSFSNENGDGNGAHGLPRPLTKKQIAALLPANAKVKVVFQTAEGVTLHGTPVHLDRHAVILELYNPSIAPQLSETLGNFKIFFQDRIVYAGRAVISNVVDAGVKTVCDATLDESNWTGLDFSAIPADGQVAQEFKNFLGEWQKLYNVSPAFKVIIADMHTFLTDLRLWLEQVELGISAAPANRSTLEEKIAKELAPAILPILTNFFEKFESNLLGLDSELLPEYQTFARRQLHPLLLCSPFLYRCFAKPLGFAGDYEMVNMMMREPLEGASLYAKIVNLWFLQQPPAEAHRNRIRRLVEHLQETTARAMRLGRTAKILNVGCGPVHEVQMFLRECHISDRAQFTLIDFNEETLGYCQSVVEEAKRKYSRATQFKYVRKSVQQIIKESNRVDGLALDGQYDLVYCAGLFDYLNDMVCQRLTDIFYGWLAPGGKLLTTNVDGFNPRRLTMDHIMEWHLFYRRGVDLLALKPAAALSDSCTVKADLTSVNIYFEAEKPERE